MMIDASGTLAAIAQAFGGKTVRAMAGFRRGLGGDGATAGDSGAMGGLRSKIRDLVAAGKVA